MRLYKKIVQKKAFWFGHQKVLKNKTPSGFMVNAWGFNGHDIKLLPTDDYGFYSFIYISYYSELQIAIQH